MIATGYTEADSKAVLDDGDIWVPRIARSTVQARAKRAIDAGVSLGLLAVTSPAFLVLAIAIKLDSPGPVFYNRHRVGKDGRPFLMFKFRTMVQDAEARLQALQARNEGGAYMIKIENDPRVTRLGRFLRRSSLDELPQLLNVLRGEMSLIGPRPQAPNEVALYTAEQRRRLAVRPGITGWWQVRARHVPSIEVMVAHDLAYINRWNLWLDATIAARTAALIAADTGRFLRRKRAAGR